MTEPYASYDDEELVSAGPDQRNWTGIGIALLVIIAFSSIILTAVFLLTPDLTGKTAKIRLTKVTLEDVLWGTFVPRTFNGSWISDREFTYRDAEGSVIIYNVDNGTKVKIMSNITFRQYNVQSYSVSPDRKYVLLATNTEKLFRFTYRAQYICYNLLSELVFSLKLEEPSPYLQYISWGPKGSQLVYVYNNNVYYKPEVTAPSIQLSHTGKEGVIYNGIPDWIYEEEIFSRDNTIWWFKEGTKLCFVTFNDTNVDTFTYPRYGSYHDAKNVYPKMTTLRYPKAGRANPTVIVWVVDLVREESFQVLPPIQYRNSEHYITNIEWMDSTSLLITWAPRSQNQTTISICAWKTGWSCIESYTEETYNGWMNLDLYPIVFNGGYFVKLPLMAGDAGSFQQVAKVNLTTGQRDFLTKEEHDVISLLTYHPALNAVFYLSTSPDNAEQQHLYSVTMDGASPVCLTCDLGNSCQYNLVYFSPETPHYYVLNCLGPGVPKVEVRNSQNNSLVDVLDTNAHLQVALKTLSLPQEQTFQVPVGDDFKATVRLFIPPLKKGEEIDKYPLVINVYAGPGSQMITDRFHIHWGIYLVTKRKYIYAWIDGRGSGNKGDKIKHEIYKRLGTVEVQDQITVARYLKNELPFVDSKKIAIWGWSYGGYVTTMVLANETNTINCGIAIAPVTKWQYYDSVYTERVMMKPEENPLGYEDATVLDKVEFIKGKKLLLVHGTADDNVHFQHSTMLIKSLTEKEILYRSQIYPDESHALLNVKHHLYKTIEDFLSSTCFITVEPPPPEQITKLIFGG